jgi:general secretion pathway protein G
MRHGEGKSTVDSRRWIVRHADWTIGRNTPAWFSTFNLQPLASRRRGQSIAGFTLLELLIVMTLILILASMVTPTYHIAIVRAREAVLRDDLYTLRTLIDQYTIDKQHPPATLQDLVDDGYLHGALPEDPFTRSNETWVPVMEDVPLSPGQTVSGIVDVHSGSDEISTDGQTAYSSW